MNAVYYYDYPIGKLGIAEEDGMITKVFYAQNKNIADYELISTPLIEKTALEISEYLNGQRKEFNVLLNPQGTTFDHLVWDALLTIPYGETRSYKEVALMIGKPKATRAVGLANNRNPIMIMIPCHRVIGQNGSLVGYAGGLSIKKQLLDNEKSHSFKRKNIAIKV